MDSTKIDAIQNWNTPTCVKDVKAFIGFCNFYQRFVLNFLKIAEPLNALTREDVLFKWTPECKKIFQDLKQRVCKAPILRFFDQNDQC